MRRGRAQRRRQRGASVLELLLVCAVGIVIATVTVTALGRAIRLRAESAPGIEATRAQSAVLLEMRLAITDAAAKIPMLDLAAMFGSLRPPTAEAAAKNGDPVDAAGLVTGSVPVPVALRYGPPPRFADGCALGPVTIPKEPLFDDQAGSAVVVLRTDPGVPRLVLARDFVASTGTVHLVGRVGVTNEAVASLAAGDVLMITGLDLAGEMATCLALVAGPPVLEHPPDAREGDPFEYYSVPVECEPDVTLPWGLEGPAESKLPIETHIARDASVAKLVAPRTYFARAGTLWMAEGDPRAASIDVVGRGAAVVPLVRGVERLDARARLADGTEVDAVTGAEAGQIRSVSIALAVTAGDDAAPRVVEIDLQPWSRRYEGAEADLVYAFAGAGGGSPSGGGPGGGGPGPGYCLAVAGDAETWPPGVDPSDPSTWDQAAWWEGFDPKDPATWYYRCEDAGGGK